MTKGGVHNETKKLVDLSADCEPVNCNQLRSTLDNEMFQYMGAHTHSDIHTLTKRKTHADIHHFNHKNSPIDMHGFYTKNGYKIPNIIYQRLAHTPSTIKFLVQFPLALILIHVMDTVSSIIHIPSERGPTRGFRTHVGTLQENRHTISYMVRKQARGPCKLLLQAHRPEWCSSVLV